MNSNFCSDLILDEKTSYTRSELTEVELFSAISCLEDLTQSVDYGILRIL